MKPKYSPPAPEKIFADLTSTLKQLQIPIKMQLRKINFIGIIAIFKYENIKFQVVFISLCVCAVDTKLSSLNHVLPPLPGDGKRFTSARLQAIPRLSRVYNISNFLQTITP